MNEIPIPLEASQYSADGMVKEGWTINHLRVLSVQGARKSRFEGQFADPDWALRVALFPDKVHPLGTRFMGPGLAIGCSRTGLSQFRNEEDMLSAWLMMHRGCRIRPISSVESLEHWILHWLRRDTVLNWSRAPVECQIQSHGESWLTNSPKHRCTGEGENVRHLWSTWNHS